MIERLADFIRAEGFEIDLDLESLADVVWLARCLPVPPEAAPLTAPAPRPFEAERIAEPLLNPEPDLIAETEPEEEEQDEQPAPPPHQEPSTQPIKPEPAVVEPTLNADSSVAIYPRPRRPLSEPLRTGTPFRAPAPAALPDSLALARSLKPLAGSRSLPGASILDEQATAERFAETDVLQPVYDDKSKRWLEAAIVFDATPEMAVWRDAIDEFARLLQLHGAFRDVRTWSLDPCGRLHRGLAPDALDSKGLTPRVLIDPRGRRLVFLATIGRGEAWQSDAIRSFFAEVLPTNPSAILHLLPPRLRHRSAIGHPTRWFHSHRPGVLNPKLPFLQLPDHFGLLPEDDQPGTSIPILGLDPASLHAYARLLVGSESLVPGIDLDHLVPAATAPPGLTGEERIESFAEWASAEAYRLAHHLASVPLMLPVMRIVHASIERHPASTALAEILASDLVQFDGEDFDFDEDVRQALYANLPRTDALRAQSSIAEYVYRHLGIRTTEDFVAEDVKGNVNLPEEAQRYIRLQLKIRRLLEPPPPPEEPKLRIVVAGPLELEAERQAAYQALDSIPGVIVTGSERLTGNIPRAGVIAEIERSDIVVLIAGVEMTTSTRTELRKAKESGKRVLAFLRHQSSDELDKIWNRHRDAIREEPEHWLYDSPAKISRTLLGRLRNVATPRGYAALVSTSPDVTNAFAPLGALLRRFGFRVEVFLNVDSAHLKEAAIKARSAAIEMPSLFLFRGDLAQGRVPEDLSFVVGEEKIPLNETISKETLFSTLLLALDAQNVGRKCRDFYHDRGLPPIILSWRREHKGKTRVHDLCQHLHDLLASGVVLKNFPAIRTFDLFLYIQQDPHFSRDLRTFLGDSRGDFFDYEVPTASLEFDAKERVRWVGDGFGSLRLNSLGLDDRLNHSAETHVSILLPHALLSEPNSQAIAQLAFRPPSFIGSASPYGTVVTDDIVNLLHRIRSIFDYPKDSPTQTTFQLFQRPVRTFGWLVQQDQLLTVGDDNASWHSLNSDETPATVYIREGKHLAINRESGDIYIATEKEVLFVTLAHEAFPDFSLPSPAAAIATVGDSLYILTATELLVSEGPQRANALASIPHEFGPGTTVDVTSHREIAIGTGRGFLFLPNNEIQRPHETAIQALVWISDPLLVAATDGKSISITSPGERITPFYLPASNVVALDASSDGQWLASLNSEGLVTLWSTRDWFAKRSYQIEACPEGGHLAFRPNSPLLAIGAKGGDRVHVIDIHEATQPAEHPRPTSILFAAQPNELSIQCHRELAERGLGTWRTPDHHSLATALATVTKPKDLILIALEGDPRPFESATDFLRLRRHFRAQNEEPIPIVIATNFDLPPRVERLARRHGIAVHKIDPRISIPGTAFGIVSALTTEHPADRPIRLTEAAIFSTSGFTVPISDLHRALTHVGIRPARVTESIGHFLDDIQDDDFAILVFPRAEKNSILATSLDTTRLQAIVRRLRARPNLRVLFFLEGLDEQIFTSLTRDLPDAAVFVIDGRRDMMNRSVAASALVAALNPESELKRTPTLEEALFRFRALAQIEPSFDVSLTNLPPAIANLPLSPQGAHVQSLLYWFGDYVEPGTREILETDGSWFVALPLACANSPHIKPLLPGAKAVVIVSDRPTPIETGPTPLFFFPASLKVGTAPEANYILSAHGLRRRLREGSPTALKKRRIAVGGTGNFKFDGSTFSLAQRLGQALAMGGYHVQTGGWEGVDEIVSRTFAESILERGEEIGLRLIHRMPKGQTPSLWNSRDLHAAGYLEADDPSDPYGLRSAVDATILIGGLGGTMDIFHAATRRSVLTIPIASTGGDAANAYRTIKTPTLSGSFSVAAVNGLERAWRRLTSPLNTGADIELTVQAVLDILEIVLEHGERSKQSPSSSARGDQATKTKTTSADEEGAGGGDPIRSPLPEGEG